MSENGTTTESKLLSAPLSSLSLQAVPDSTAEYSATVEGESDSESQIRMHSSLAG